MQISVVIPNYNSAATVVRAAQEALAQDAGAGHAVTVVIVDDGSTDGSAQSLAKTLGARICLIALPENKGRSTARNAGARATDADLLVFIDSDCVPVGRSFIREHVGAIEKGADVSFGQVCTPGERFWDQLQRNSSEWRARAFERGETWTFTTQNVAMTRKMFENTGGFDPIFDRFGFEDRDLFVRLEQCGARALYTPTAQVTHEDRITLASVARKQGEAGYHSAHLFRNRHPGVYARMAYGRLDCALHPWLTSVDFLLSPLASWLAKGPARWLEWRWLPFGLRALSARLVYGLCYLHGTAARIAMDRASTTTS